MESRNGLDSNELRKKRRQRLRRRRQQQILRRTILLIALVFACVFGLISLVGNQKGDASKDEQVEIASHTDPPSYTREEDPEEDGAEEATSQEKEPSEADLKEDKETEEKTGPEEQVKEEKEKEAEEEEEEEEEDEDLPERSDDAAFFAKGYSPKSYNKTRPIDDEDIISSYIVLIDAETNRIEAARNATTVMNPASMTKVLTLLVCSEQIENMKKKVKMTQSANDYAYVTGSNSSGLEVGEKLSALDMLYCTILPSGADAAVSLAEYVSGSQEAFVDLMNQKVRELGRDDTAHFSNCVGIYDEELHCTVIDMAMIMKAALEDKLCRKVLSAHTYTTGSSKVHPDGIFMSNLFLRRIEDYDDDFGVVQSAKTGYVEMAGSCAVSYCITHSGHRYILVTGNSTGSWNCIYDHVNVYARYTK